MGLFGGMPLPDNFPSVQAPALPPDLQNLMAPQTVQRPIAPQPTAPPQPMAGLKRPPPKVGTTVNGYTYLGGDPRSQDPSVWHPASGDTFLNSLPLDDQKKTLVKAIANYELPPGSARGGLGSPEVQQLLAFAKQYDPNFSAPDYTVRQGVRKAFSDGQYSKTVTALNTAIDHARTLAEEGKSLNNYGSPLLNAPINFIQQHVMGDTRQGKFEQTARNLGGEVVKAVTGGEGALDDRIKAAEDYSLNGSPQQQTGALENTVDLLKSKLDELNATYKRGMGPQHDVLELLSPSARKSWQVLSTQFGPNAGHGALGGAPKAASGPPHGVDAKTWAHMTPQERALWP